MEYYYIFKDEYLEILREDYKNIHDKICFKDINEMSDKYSLFIRKLMFLIMNDRNNEISKYRELFNSNNCLDRLKGLKDSKKYIRLVGEEKC